MHKRDRQTLLIECGPFVLVDTVAENLGSAELSMTVVRRRAERAQRKLMRPAVRRTRLGETQ